jgi:hypothetical protein
MHFPIEKTNITHSAKPRIALAVQITTRKMTPNRLALANNAALHSMM